MEINKIRPIKFFCKSCGKEIWQQLEYKEHQDSPLWALLLNCECADCFLKRVKSKE